MKPSEIFEGEDSSLKKAFENTKTMRERFDNQFTEVILDQEVRTVAEGIKLFIEQEIKKERDEIVEKLKSKQKTLRKEIEKYKKLPFYREAGEVRGELAMLTDIISIITNNSNINK